MTAQVMITDLGTLDPRAINNLGQVVGNSSGHAYLWQNGTLTDLGAQSVAYAINDLGQVVGSSSGRAFLWQNGVMTDLGTLPGGNSSRAYGINNLGQVVGQSTTMYVGYFAFLWQSGTMTDLGAVGDPDGGAYGINELGQIVGARVIGTLGWTHAFLWQNDTFRDLGALPRGADSYAYDINELGQIVGYSDITFANPSYGYHHAFLWQQNSGMMDLGTLGVSNSNSYAVAINDLGQVVGASEIAEWNSQRHVFLWRKDKQNGKMIDLNRLVASTGWTLYDVSDINNVGQVVGKVMLNSQVRNILLQLPPDLSVESVEPVQVLENQDLVKYKATAVKAVIRKDGGGTAENVPVKLVDGASTYTRFYVADQGNLDPNHVLMADDSTYPLNFAVDEITKTIYFFNDRLAPLGSNFQVSVTVDYRDEILELDEDNNTATSRTVPVYDTQWPSADPGLSLTIYYVNTDGVSRSEFDANYTASNNFVQGVYPVSELRFFPGRASTTFNTFAWRGSDGKLDWRELAQWITDTLPLLRLAHPYTDRFVATVPSGWFQATTTNTEGVTLTNVVGLAYPDMRELVVAEARTSTRPNGSNLVAHEIGHSYRLGLTCEEYDANCDHVQDRNGITVTRGLWVNKRIPIQVPTEHDVYCFMGAGPGLEYWVDAADYSKLLNEHRATAALRANLPITAAGAILVVANFDMNGGVTLGNWYTLPDATLSELPAGPYVFEYQDANGNVLYQRSFDISYSVEGGYIVPQAALVATIPAIPGTAKIVVKHYDVPKSEKVFSANPPVVTVLSPNGGEQLWGSATIRWSGSDADGDALSYAVLISPDNGATWEPVAGDLTATSYTWDISQLPAGAQYLIKVVATDGINTGHDVSDTPFTIKTQTYLPLVLRHS